MKALAVRFCLLCCAVFVGLVSTAEAQDLKWVTSKPVPDWIWDARGSSGGQKIFLRKQFEVRKRVKSAKVYTTCDNKMTLWINGQEVGKARDWMYPLVVEVT